MVSRHGSFRSTKSVLMHLVSLKVSVIGTRSYSPSLTQIMRPALETKTDFKIRSPS